MNLEEGFSFKVAVQIFAWMPCRLRFLLNVLMLIPSNVNIPNGFTNSCLLTNIRFLINLARWVRVLNKLLIFLVIHLNSDLKLLIGELMEFCQESLSYELILWPIWKLHQYRFFRNFKKIRWYDELILLVLSLILLMLIISDERRGEKMRKLKDER